MIKKLLILIISINLFAQANYQKLKENMVKIIDNRYVIEEFNKITFDKEILFSKKKLKAVVIKTKAIMNKGIINKEYFIAISSSISDQIIESIFMNPTYFEKIKSIDWLNKKPKSSDFNIELLFVKNGINVVLKSDSREEKQFISYDELFHQRLKP